MKKPIQPQDAIIVALDVKTPGDAIDLVRMLSPHVGAFKIGLELITGMLTAVITAGSETEANFAAKKIRDLFALIDGKVFWDGKFNDIPNTVAGAAGALKKLNVKMFNVHASCTIEAMMRAVENKGDALVLAVTVLTSTDEHDAELIFGTSTKAKVLQFARDAALAGCDGLVCSPQELTFLAKRRELNRLLRVTPGIRYRDSPPDDQKRTMPAFDAIIAGADYLVIGRPITDAPDPVAAAQKFAEEIAAGLAAKENAGKGNKK